jgi:hypothetical protein
MKTKILLTIIISITLFSCVSAVTPASIDTPVLHIMVISTFTPNPTAEISIFTSTSTMGFTDPNPETWVMLMPAVREYLYYRKKAVIAGNVEVLWEQYPELKVGADFSKGINAEEFFINNMQGLKPFDGNIFPEYYERMKVNILGETAEVLVHWLELYLYVDETGRFEDSGGEFRVIIFLRHQDNQWTVYKTHDISGP